MSTTTQYNPNFDLNARLLEAGCSKTVYALVTPPTEAVKLEVLAAPGYLDMFRDAWTGKQDAIHNEFFDLWTAWTSPVIDFNRSEYPFCYPTAGASEALRHLIYDHAAKGGERIHIFEGEYEGYKAMAEAAGLAVVEHPRIPAWQRIIDLAVELTSRWTAADQFFVSQPSAIDGNVWRDFNAFVASMPENSVIADITYVGAVPKRSINQRFNLNAPAIRNVVFSLSKPFGVYYDRIGGVFCRSEDAGLFGNKWFKNLTSISIGTALMKAHDVFDYPHRYAVAQQVAIARAEAVLGMRFEPSDVFILAGARAGMPTSALAEYINRAGRYRICLTPGMAADLGTSSAVT